MDVLLLVFATQLVFLYGMILISDYAKARKGALIDNEVVEMVGAGPATEYRLK